MAPTTPPLNSKHKKGEEIPTKNNEAISEMHSFVKALIATIQLRYKPEA
jgi:hypothetical protein